MQRLILVWLFVPALALGKPKIVIVPIDGPGAKDVEAALVEVMGEDGTVVKPKDVKAAMAKLKVSGELDDNDVERLQKKLSATVVIQGSITKNEGKKNLKLSINVRDKKAKGFSLEYKNATSDKFKAAMHDELVKRIAAADEEDEDDKKKKRLAEEEEDKKRKAQAEEDDRKKKRVSEDDDDRKKKKRGAEDDDGDKKKKKKKVATAEEGGDDDNGKVKKKRKKRGGDSDGDEMSAKERAQLAGRVMVRVDGGLSFGVRRLTYTANMPPPRVGTASGGARIEGELYPWAGSEGATAGVGLAGEFDKTFGLSITIPGGQSVPIDKQHFSIGARYRFGVGTASTVALGLDFVKRKYVADRSGLAQPNDLDAPDVNYSAAGPGISFRSPLSPKAAFFGGLRGLLIFNTGPIQKSDSYGAATVFGAELESGVDFAVASGWALRLGAEYSQINFKFKGTGALAGPRGVTAATDRNIGAAATLAMKY